MRLWPLITRSGSLSRDYPTARSVNKILYRDSDEYAGDYRVLFLQGWPRSEAYIQKKMEELLEAHKDWPDRSTMFSLLFDPNKNTLFNRIETINKAYSKYYGKGKENEKSEL